MSVEIINSIKKQVEVLTSQEKFDLANYLLEGAQKTESVNGENGKSDIAEDVRLKRMNWLKANRKKYGGQYVVLDGDKFLGAATNFSEGKKVAADAGVPDAFVNYLSKPDEEGYIGSW